MEATVFNLNSIPNGVKQALYNLLLKGKLTAEMNLMPPSGVPYLVHVDFNDNDLCVSSFTRNFYIRTPHAVKRKRYKSFGAAVAAMKRIVNSRLTDKIVSSLRIYNKDGWHLFSIEL